MISHRPLRILLIEDDEDHADLAEAAVADCRHPTELERVTSGEEALELLQTSLFDLLLLDLHLPRLSGRELLTRIKSDPRMQDTPIVVLSASQYLDEQWRDCRPPRTCYVEKPITAQQLDTVIQMVEHFWFAIKNQTPGIETPS